MTGPVELTDRDLELIEVALLSAAQACSGFTPRSPKADLDDLTKEYLAAYERVRVVRLRGVLKRLP